MTSPTETEPITAPDTPSCPARPVPLGGTHERSCRIYELNIIHRQRTRDRATVSLWTVIAPDTELASCGCSAVMIRNYGRAGHYGEAAAVSPPGQRRPSCPRASWITPLDKPPGAANVAWSALFEIQPASAVTADATHSVYAGPQGVRDGLVVSAAITNRLALTRERDDPTPMDWAQRCPVQTVGPFKTWDDAVTWLDRNSDPGRFTALGPIIRYYEPTETGYIAAQGRPL